MRVWVSSVRRNGGSTGASASSPARTARPRRPAPGPPSASFTMRIASRASEETGRTDSEDGGHGREKREVRQLGEERLAEVVEEPDQEASDQGPAQAAHPADDNDDERVGEDLEVRAGVHAEEASRDDAGDGR